MLAYNAGEQRDRCAASLANQTQARIAGAPLCVREMDYRRNGSRASGDLPCRRVMQARLVASCAGGLMTTYLGIMMIPANKVNGGTMQCIAALYHISRAPS
jgi:hypothetical protein